jgi:hypothetical protein
MNMEIVINSVVVLFNAATTTAAAIARAWHDKRMICCVAMLFL